MSSRESWDFCTQKGYTRDKVQGLRRKCRENALAAQRRERRFLLEVCVEGGQRLIPLIGKVFWKRQGLAWVLKGNGLGCAEKVGKCRTGMLVGAPLAEAERAQMGKTEVGSEDCGPDPMKPKGHVGRYVGAVVKSPGFEV